MSKSILRPGITGWLLSLVIGGVLSGAGCAGMPSAVEQSYLRLSERAAFDFACPQTQLTMAPIGSEDDQVRVKGCGKRATYVEMSGRWLMDTPPMSSRAQAQRSAHQQL